MDTRGSVVMDVGSHTCKAGLSGDSDPTLLIKTVTGRHPNEDDIYSQYKPTTLCNRSDEILTGDRLCSPCGHMIRKYPVSRGSVTDWDHMVVILAHIYNRLGVQAQDQPTVITEPPYNPKCNREKAIEIMFEHFHVPSFHILIDTPLAFHGTGRTTGVALVCGDDVTSAIAMYDGVIFNRSCHRQNFGGRDVTNYLKHLLSERGCNMTLWGSTIEHLGKMKDSIAMSEDDGDNALKTYTLPDGNILSLAEEQWRCSDVLFNPSLIGKEYPGLPTMVQDCIRMADIDCRRDLYRSVLLAGGTAKLTGLHGRLQTELQTITVDGVKANVTAPSVCQTAVWRGAAVTSHMTTFRSQFISRAEYDEHGTVIVNKKCWSLT